jgi:hypothetical protein
MGSILIVAGENGTKCSGKTITVGTYENAVLGIDTKLARLGPEVPVAVKADKMASLIAALCDKDQSVVKRFLLLIEPFTYSLIFEVCALVSFSFGFLHRRRPSNGSAENSSQHETLQPFAGSGATVSNGWHHHSLDDGTVTVHSFPTVEPLNSSTIEPSNRSPEPLNYPIEPSNHRVDEPSKPSNGSADKPSEPAPSNRPTNEPSKPSNPPVEPSNGPQRRAVSKDEALAALLTDLALGRGFGSQDELAERFNRPKSTISVWLKDWTTQGLIPERSVRGRCKSLNG